MKIYFSPYYQGPCYINMPANHLLMDTLVVETQGLLTLLADHAGIHQEVPPYPARLAAYHEALMAYDETAPNNIFHKSVAIDSLSVAKTLLRWRDTLALGGWEAGTLIEDSARLNTMAVIEKGFIDKGPAALYRKLTAELTDMEAGKRNVPGIYKEMEIVIPCEKNVLPAYIKALLEKLLKIGVTMIEEAPNSTKKPSCIREIHFSQRWKAEVWLAHQEKGSFDVWLNRDNKRLDNWLHMSGQPMVGSTMHESNPQITQMFLLAVQLFQRPLNLNTLLDYLYLPECPLDWKLRTRLARALGRTGGFCHEDVKNCIKQYIETAFCESDSDTIVDTTPKDRKKNYQDYLPFNLIEEGEDLVKENDMVNMDVLKNFLGRIGHYATHRAQSLSSISEYDARTEQLRSVAAMTEALLTMVKEKDIAFNTLLQWAQALYEEGSYTLYDCQLGSRFFINNAACMISEAKNVVWCDFYGEESAALTTDFLSELEMQQLRELGLLSWEPEDEKALQHAQQKRPLYQTRNELTLITCEKQGITLQAKHPLSLQLPYQPAMVDGDALYEALCKKDVVPVDNHREKDARELTFDAKEFPITWRKEESYSSLEKLLQNPMDYFMKYVLGFHEIGTTDLKLSTTMGNVAHGTIEHLFTTERNDEGLTTYVTDHYDAAFDKALATAGALLLLPEHHIEKEKLRHCLRTDVAHLAEIIEANLLTVTACEQKEEQDLGFDGSILINGYIDMLLRDAAGRDVVFDLKWSSKKDKFLTLLTNNRAAQLILYQAMLQQHEGQPAAARTAFFVMPEGKLYSYDDFDGEYCNKVDRPDADIMDQLRNGYAKRKSEINAGIIETADNVEIAELEYTRAGDVFPLETEGSRPPKKATNKYSDYKCFTL